jgi:hypothetical protein
MAAEAKAIALLATAARKIAPLFNARKLPSAPECRKELKP